MTKGKNAAIVFYVDLVRNVLKARLKMIEEVGI